MKHIGDKKILALAIIADISIIAMFCALFVINNKTVVNILGFTIFVLAYFAVGINAEAIKKLEEKSSSRNLKEKENDKKEREESRSK